MSEPTTPLMQQYHAIKARYPHALLLFRLGDFYELFYEDAMIASRELQITLTSRNREKGQPIPMCGVPYHAAEGYVARLIRSGFKIAICDQMEQPGPGKKLVLREVVRVITPGTATDGARLKAKENIFLASFFQDTSAGVIGLAFVDLSTGEFQCTEFSGPRSEEALRDELQLLHPRETLLPRTAQLFETAKTSLLDGVGGVESRIDDWAFQLDYTQRIVKEQFGVAELTSFGLDGHIHAIAASGAIVHYLRENAAKGTDSSAGVGTNGPTTLEALGHLDRVRYYEQHDALVLDPVSVRNFVTPPPAGGSALLRRLHGEIDELNDVRETLEHSIADEPPALATDPGMIRLGFHAELDELRNLSQHSKQIIAAMEERERKRTGIGSLKIRFNQVFGYYIEISKANMHLAPADYERKQTLVNAERFTSPEPKTYERKLPAADERILQIERQLFIEVRSSIAAKATRLRRTAAAVAQLDVLTCLAKLAADRGYVRPKFNDAGELLLVAGRHPVIEELLRQKGERFVPNDLYFEPHRQQLLLITGPNMGGKSTYLRQTALIILMAQMGSFVPARQAKLPLTDRIFTRIGASDNLARGRSTFLVEMSEVASILTHATPASLVLLDEVGRGNETFDGLSIAWAVVEHLQKHTRARTLFATHYHELTELADLLPAVKNVHVSVKETPNEIVFLRHVEPGSASKSYGIEVARLAGLPRSVIERARDVLKKHEQSEHELSERLTPGASDAASSNGQQQVLFTPIDREVLERLRATDLDQLRPIDALTLLADLKKQIS